MFIPEVDPCSHMESQVLRNLGAELWKVTKEAGQLPLTEHSKEIETDVVGNLMIIKKGAGGNNYHYIYVYIYIYIIHKSSQESIHQSTSQNIISIIGETLMLNYFRIFDIFS